MPLFVNQKMRHTFGVGYDALDLNLWRNGTSTLKGQPVVLL